MCTCPTAEFFPHREVKCTFKIIIKAVNDEIKRQAEEERQAEKESQAEKERQVEIAKQAEARKKDLANQLKQANIKVLRLQKELFTTTENIRRLQAELTDM
jgi:hypothetical protein